MKKVLFISLAVIFALSVGLIGCEGEGPTPPELPSEYIGSGALDGDGIPVDFFTDLDVRKGFCYAFDYQTYIDEALSGQGEVRGSPVVEGLPYYNPAASKYSYCLTKAEEHLMAAWDGDVWDLGFKFTVLYNAGNLPRKTACEMLSESLLGLNPLFQVSILPITWPAFLGKIWGTLDMPMFQIGWLPDYPHPDNFIVPFMHSTGGAYSAYVGYGDAALDTQISEAFMDTNPTTQQDKYYALQEYFYQDPEGIMLGQPYARRYFTEHINGFIYNPCESAYTGRLINMSKSDNGDHPFKNPNDFIYETIGEIDSLDPAWIYDTASGMQVGLLYEQLIYYDGNSTDTFVPILATDTGTFNATSLELRFTIKEGVQFHDGNNLTATDVEYTFERAMVQDRTGGPIWMFYQPLLGPDVWHFGDTTFAEIDAAVEDDGNDIVFTLYGDYWLTAFKQILCGQWACIVDKESTVAKTGAWDGTAGTAQAYCDSITTTPSDSELFDDPNGTGPWKFNSWLANDQIILEDFTGYHGGSVPFENVITKVRDEWSTRKLALQAGDADLVYVPATNFDEMDEETGLLVYQDLPSLSIDSFHFNQAIGG